MKKVRNIKERICALILAVLLPLTSVLPGAAVTVQAAETEHTISFYVYEEYTPDTNKPDEKGKLPLSGAEVTLKVTESGRSDDYKGTTDQNGKVTLKATFDSDTATGTYDISKTGFETVSDQSIDLKADYSSTPQEQALKMSDIRVSSETVNLEYGTGSNDTATVTIQKEVVNTAEKEFGYTWTSTDENVAKVNSDGTITAAGKGNTTVTVSRNGVEKAINVTVKQKLSDMKLTVNPETGTNLTEKTAVDFTLTGMPVDANKQVTLYQNDQQIGSITKSNNNKWKTTIRNLDLKGNVTFKAVYPSDDDNYYLETSVSTEGLSYKQQAALTLTEASKTVTYGDSNNSGKIDTGDSEKTRTLKFKSSDTDVATVDNNGTYTIHKAGNATITVTAEENSEYTEAEATYELTVNQKDISIKAEEVQWDAASKVYDGTDAVSLTGRVKGIGNVSNSDVVGNDELIITAEVKLDSADASASAYTSATITTVKAADITEAPANGSYRITLDSDTLAADKLLADLEIKVDYRDVYLHAEQISGTTPNIEYGSVSEDEIKSTAMECFQVTLVGTNGKIDTNVEDQGVLDGDVDSLKSMLSGSNAQAQVQANIPEGTTFYVGEYPIVEVNITDARWKNYTLCFQDKDEYKGTIHIVQEVTTDDELWNKVSVKKLDGIDQTDLYSDETGALWAAEGDNLSFISTDTNYDGINVKSGDSYGSMLSVPQGTEDIWSLTNSIYLSNSNDDDTRTTKGSSNNVDNQIPSGKLRVDATLPTVEFSGIEGGKDPIAESYPFGGFTTFTNQDYVASVSLEDVGSGLDTKNMYYHLLKIENKDINVTEAIIQAAGDSGTVWNKFDVTNGSGIVSVPKTEEGGFYIILVKASDNVGNEAVYASNGLVIEINKPQAELEITSESVDGFYAGDIEYDIKVTDPNTEVYSGISKVEVTVTDGETTVSGDKQNYTNSYTLENEDLDKLKENIAGNGSYSLTELYEKSTYNISGAIIADDCSSNKVTINVTAYDQAGNVSDKEEKVINLDNDPIINSLTYDVTDADNCYQRRTMTIEYQYRNFNPSTTGFFISENGGEKKTVTLKEITNGTVAGVNAVVTNDSEGEGWEKDYHTKDRKITYAVTFGPQTDQDITYQITPYIENKAGIPTEYEDQTFTVDNLAPVIDVKYNNNEVQNEKYFKAPRTMTITYTERNFDDTLLSFELSVNGEKSIVTLADLTEMASEENAIDVGNVEVSEESEDTHILEITFGADDKDIDYSIVPYITDQADNTNSGVNYADTEYADNANTEFTVDMVAPVVSLNYVKDNLENGSAANITTDSDASVWYYANTVVFGTATITERNFALNENSFAQDQMNLSYTATDADGGAVETNNYTDNAGTRDKWTAGDENENVQVFEFIEDANYTFGLTYTDLAGNQAVYDTHYFTVDKTAPTGTIKVSGSDPEGKESSLIEKLGQILFGFFRNEETTITFESDDTTSLYTQKYAIYDPEDIINASTNTPQLKPTENEETLAGIPAAEWVGSDEFTRSIAAQEYKTHADSEQIPYMRLEDKAGNVAFYSTEGVIDDRTDSDPEIEITTIDPSTGTTDTGKEIFDGDVAFAISVTDPETNGTYSGLHSVSYRVLKDGEATQDYVYYEESVAELQAKDRVRSIEWNQETADKPIVDAELNNSNDVVIEVKAEDNSGNVTVVTRELAIDITDPRIDVEYDNNDVRNGTYFKEDRIMTVTYTERNFFEEGLTFDVTRDGTTQNGISLATLKTLDGIVVESGPADSQDEYAFKELKDDRTVQYTIRFDGGTSEDMDYAISLHIEDEAANTDNGVKYAENTKAAETFTVDKVAPLLTVVYRAGNSIIEPGLQKEPLVSENKDDITAAVTIEERNFSLTERFADGQMNLTYTAVDAYGETVGTSTDADAENPIENYTETANTRSEWQTGSDGEQYVRTHTFTFTKDANYTFALQYTDLAGNAAVDADDSTVTGHPAHYFTVDKTAPTGSIQIRESVWTRLFETVTFGFFTNSSDRVTFTSADKTADVATTQYYRYIPSTESRGRFSGLTVEELDRITEWRTAAPLTLNTEQQVIIYEKIVDRAGNVTYINSREGVVVDKTDADPVITITMADPAHGIYNSNVPFRISVTDPTSGGTYAGLKEVYYEVRKDGSVTQSGNYNSELTDRTQRRKSITKNEVVNARINNSNTVQIWVKAVDWAGNESEVTKDIKIDITDPTISVTYDLNSPLNDRYYNATRTATVVVTERNFDESSVRFDITNTDGTQPSISGWSHSADSGVSDSATHTCRVTFSADGDYTFTLNTTDLAGNDSSYTQVDEFTIDQTDPVIQVSYDNNNDETAGYFNENRTATITVTEHNFNASEVNAVITARLQGSGVSAPGVGGWSTRGDVHTASVTFSEDADYTFDIEYTDLAGNAAAEYTEDSFTVDKTAPEIEFFDIEDKSANKGTVAPGVRYSDVNYTEAGVDITIEGAKDEHSVTALDGERSGIPNGESIKMADFAHTEDNDDVYTMRAVIRDKAGNETEESIIFSVNRFGSTYEFSPETKAFLEKFYTNDPQNIVVTERNVDTLVFNGISYGRDGQQTELTEGEDYTVKASGSEVSWKEYVYDISSDNFQEEGRYNVTIDSEDRAENMMNNKVKGLDIEFVVDKTAPTVVVTGIEEDSYRADTRDMTINVADNTAVATVEVLIDGAVVEEYTQEQIEKVNGALTYTIGNSNNSQDIRVVAVDLAGNEGASDDREVLITSNLFIQYINNTPLFVGSIIGVIVIAGGLIWFFLIFKRRKKDEGQNA